MSEHLGGIRDEEGGEFIDLWLLENCYKQVINQQCWRVDASLRVMPRTVPW